MSAVLRALAEPRRREILRLVWDREQSAGEIHRGVGAVTFGAISQHLKVLADAGLVRRRTEGRFHYYQADKHALAPFRRWLESMWDHALADLKRLAEEDAAREPPEQGAAKPTKTHRRKRS